MRYDILAKVQVEKNERERERGRVELLSAQRLLGWVGAELKK
jgi:hypothetical protein